jgi:dynein heavy chain 1, cytosolic
MDSSFLERMNTLLANGEVPGLFEGDEYSALLTQCKEGAQRQGLMLDSNDELYKWFTIQVRNIENNIVDMSSCERSSYSFATRSCEIFMSFSQ